MPGWHAATSQLRDSDRLVTTGVALEQHPDRTRLFMQWHQMDWPVLWDPFNILGFPVVPVTYLLNPEGAVLAVQPLLDRVDELQRRIFSLTSDRHESPESAPPKRVFGPEFTRPPSDDSAPMAWSDHAAALAIWGEGDLDDAVAAARRAAEGGSDPVLWFRLGVTLRMRYDSSNRRQGDFVGAVAAWTRALDADPNQYIWRRRLQQYGPRLAKPYPFYDWVPKARQDIVARGEDPVELRVEPHGAEYAQPSDQLVSDGEVEPASEPDPNGRVMVDEKGLIEVETVVIPPSARPGEGVRVHLILTPNPALDAHWNNEAGHGELWVDPPHGWQIDQQHQLLPTGPADISDEARHIEFEVVVPEDADAGETITGNLLYYACEGATGVCVYRRQDLSIPIDLSMSKEAFGLAG